MTILIFIGVGAALILAGVLLPSMAYAVFGDEMPTWIEDWGPFLGICITLLGALVIFAGIAYGVYT